MIKTSNFVKCFLETQMISQACQATPSSQKNKLNFIQYFLYSFFFFKAKNNLLFYQFHDHRHVKKSQNGLLRWLRRQKFSFWNSTRNWNASIDYADATTKIKINFNPTSKLTTISITAIKFTISDVGVMVTTLKCPAILYSSMAYHNDHHKIFVIDEAANYTYLQSMLLSDNMTTIR